MFAFCTSVDRLYTSVKTEVVRRSLFLTRILNIYDINSSKQKKNGPIFFLTFKLDIKSIEILHLQAILVVSIQNVITSQHPDRDALMER